MRVFHRVVNGDSWAGIAKLKLGDARMFAILQSINGGSRVLNLDEYVRLTDKCRCGVSIPPDAVVGTNCYSCEEVWNERDIPNSD